MSAVDTIVPMKLPISYADAVKKTPELFLIEMSNDAIQNANNMLTERSKTKSNRLIDDDVIKEAMELRKSDMIEGLPIDENDPLDRWIKVVISDDYDSSIIDYLRDIDEVKKRENAEENKLIEERNKRKKQDDIIIKELLTVKNLLQQKIATIPDTDEWVITKKLLSEKLDEVIETHHNYINSHEFLIDYMHENNLSHQDVFGYMP
jgi:hypothetical protein